MGKLWKQLKRWWEWVFRGEILYFPLLDNIKTEVFFFYGKSNQKSQKKGRKKVSRRALQKSSLHSTSTDLWVWMEVCCPGVVLIYTGGGCVRRPPASDWHQLSVRLDKHEEVSSRSEELPCTNKPDSRFSSPMRSQQIKTPKEHGFELITRGILTGACRYTTLA